jgi:enoyl-CoA hydratase/carnithine racemase
MTTAADFAELKAAVGDDEVVTHSYVRDIPISGGKTLALITLDNDRDHTRPSTLGPITLLEFSDVLDALTERAAKKEIAGVAVTGKQYIFAAGADLSKVSEIPSRAVGKQMAQLGRCALLHVLQRTRPRRRR